MLDSELPDSHSKVSGEKTQASVFHVTNPNAISWAELIPPLKEQIGVHRIVSLRDWIELIREGPDEDSSVIQNPARKILQFYEALASAAGSDSAEKRFELNNMARCSETFRKLQPVSGEWLIKWATKWD